MKQEKTYEEKVNDIKRYLKEKEQEVANNKISEVRKNPLKKSEDVFKFDDADDDNYFNKINIKDNKEIKEKKIIEKKEENKVKKKKNNKINIILIILLLLCPLFISLSIISMHSTYLIREPFNYIMFALSGVSLIGLICFTLLKIVNNKKKTKKLKYFIIIFILLLLDFIIMILIVKYDLWKKIDFILEHKKLFVILFGIIILFLIVFALIKKIKHIRLKPTISRTLITIFMTIYILCHINVLVILYGPTKEIKEWFITTAMQTLNHQYFCKWFYSEKEINQILSENYVLESGESTNPDLVNTKKEEVVVYENEYEEAVLKKEHKDDLYKIIELEVNGCKGYLAVIYDPTTVHVAITNRLGVAGQYVTAMARDRKAVLGINGGGFWDPDYSSAGGTPMGITIVNGEIKTNNEYGTNVQGGGIIGFDEKGVLYLLKNTTAKQAIEMGIVDAVSWGPFLIVNGEPSFIKGNGGWGYAARTAIGQRADGIILMLTVDSNASRTKGADMVDMTEIMQTYGAINAANLDGGTSTVMVMPKETALKYNPNCTDDYCVINDPIDGGLSHATRAIADAFVVIPK